MGTLRDASRFPVKRPVSRKGTGPTSQMSRIAIIGRGRLGTALTAALRAAGRPVEGPLGRGEPPSPGTAAVLLCVPDSEIASVAATIPPGPLVGHCSGATPIAALGDRPAFGLHPLMTV